ncbi:spore coat protein U domain-containing protein [Rhodanobacter sp. C01]|uniref:spore coat protein U domain-containing protein n=1 Tax=Rhodanobacter sp. C01 TaxID=1945856 RepID=UPI00143A2552|nr:spore coat protein U domain-containing protein [Rhodanobacter sp. C01]
MDVMQAADLRIMQFTCVAYWNPVMNRSMLALALLAGALSWPAVLFSNAHAGEGRSRLSIMATVSSYCDIGGSPSLKLGRGLLDFGQHRVIDTVAGLNDQDLSQPVKGIMPLQCSDEVTPEVSFDYGLHSTGKQRNLQGPGGSLVPYDLLRGNNVNQGFWDDDAYPVSTAGGNLGGVPVYGYIRSLPVNAKDGFYTDTVTVRVDF